MERPLRMGMHYLAAIIKVSVDQSFNGALNRHQLVYPRRWYDHSWDDWHDFYPYSLDYLGYDSRFC